MNRLLRFSAKVEKALLEQQPIVALESTIISHGMPYPQNLAMATQVQDIIREQGCVPATIAISKGKFNIGLSDKELEYFAKNQDIVKASRRDIPILLAQGAFGATTVSATMMGAHMAGISVFVTGGIGGVHRNVNETMDISADLTELGKTPMAVVCAGVKSILDVGKTLEYLETEGVPVISFALSKKFPNFFTQESGFEAPYASMNAEEIAMAIHTNNTLRSPSGMLIAVPPPATPPLITQEDLEIKIQEGLQQAETLSIRGKAVTPFLLDYLKKSTQGITLAKNIDLVKNNARVGAQIARELNKIQKRFLHTKKRSKAMVIGGSVMDIISRHVGHQSSVGGPGHCHQIMGGVGRNVAEACLKSGISPAFVSVTGRDAFGDVLQQSFQNLRLNNHFVLRGNGRTAVYNAILDSSGELMADCADMSIHSEIQGQACADAIHEIQPNIVAMDGNLTIETMSQIISACKSLGIPGVLYEPTSLSKCTKLLKVPKHLLKETFIIVTPNQKELESMGLEMNVTNDLIQHTSTLFNIMIVKYGKDGIRLIRKENEFIKMDHFALPPLKKEILSASGAGDTLAGTIVAAIAKYGIELNWNQIMPIAMSNAESSLYSHLSVPEALTFV